MPNEGTFTHQELFTLKNLITIGRDDFEFRYSTLADVERFDEPRDANFIKAELREWCFITIEDKRDHGRAAVFLTGIRTDT